MKEMIWKKNKKGLHLDEETRNKVKDIKEKISDLAIKFSKHCNEEATTFNFTSDELGKNFITFHE